MDCLLDVLWLALRNLITCNSKPPVDSQHALASPENKRVDDSVPPLDVSTASENAGAADPVNYQDAPTTTPAKRVNENVPPLHERAGSDNAGSADASGSPLQIYEKKIEASISAVLADAEAEAASWALTRAEAVASLKRAQAAAEAAEVHAQAAVQAAEEHEQAVAAAAERHAQTA